MLDLGGIALAAWTSLLGDQSRARLNVLLHIKALPHWAQQCLYVSARFDQVIYFCLACQFSGVISRDVIIPTPLRRAPEL